MRRILIITLLILFAQKEGDITTGKVWRVNFLNPAVELELPTGAHSTFSSAIGIGYGGGYPDLTGAGNGFIYIIAPFIDIQQKWFYNFARRNTKGKVVSNNSANYFSISGITRGHSIAENVFRTSNFDFAIGPTWGIQRKFGKRFHFLFDLGPQFYFDTNGNSNIWPLMLQLNLGFDLERKR